MKILIAEDNPTSLMLLKAYLDQWGHEAVSCQNGEEAWEILQQEDAPKLVILDWLMPKLNGREVCRRIRANDDLHLAYVIFVTAKDSQEDMLEVLNGGGDDYIAKPFEADELRVKIQVGTRVVTLWERLLQAERDRVLVETAGAAAHELNQPLTILMGNLQLVLANNQLDEDQRQIFQDIYQAGERITEVVKKMTTTRQYTISSYTAGVNIVKFDKTEQR